MPLYRRLLVSSLQGRPFVGIGGSGKRLTSIHKSLYIEMTFLLILISGMDWFIRHILEDQASDPPIPLPLFLTEVRDRLQSPDKPFIGVDQKFIARAHPLMVISGRTRGREKMKELARRISILLIVLLAGACASTPTWKDMSESDIAAWQELGIDAGGAQQFVKAGLNAADVKGWYEAGIASSDAILAWHGKGFTSNEAANWSQQQFSVDQAVQWKKENFEPEEAGKWKSAEFDLDDAIKNREKGLQPIR